MTLKKRRSAPSGKGTDRKDFIKLLTVVPKPLLQKKQDWLLHRHWRKPELWQTCRGAR